ncbi:FecR family protein [Flagellimonas sp. 2504JD1-5]
MDNKGIKGYIKKYLEGTISEEEEKQLERFEKHLVQSNAHKVFRNAHHKRMVKKQLQTVIDNPFKKKRRQYLKIAASIVIMLGLSITAYYSVRKPQVEITSIITSTTELGQKMNITLSDGTKVRLNSGSALTFPQKFGSDAQTREVELVGEAFFEVAKDAKRPFIITSGGLKTTVLGTSFNINAYPDNENITVTVATGKVMVTSNDDEFALDPNQQAVYHKEQNGIIKQEVDILSFVEWKNGTLRMENITLKEAAKELEKWYGVKITFENPRLSKYKFAGTFYNNEKLQVVLESIKYALKEIDYERLGEKEILIKEK